MISWKHVRMLGHIFTFALLPTICLITAECALAAGVASPPKPSTSAAQSQPNKTPTLVAKDNLAVIGQPAKLRASVTAANGMSTANLEIGFYVGNQEVGKAKTGADGTAEFIYVIPDTMMPGATPFEAHLANSTTVAKANLAVFKAKTTISDITTNQWPLPPVPGEGKNHIQITGNLNSGDPKGTSVGRKVKVSLGKKEILVTTSVFTKIGSGGYSPGGSFEADFDLESKDLGKSLPVTISFDGDNQYLNCAAPQMDVAIRGVPKPINLLADLYGWPGANSSPKLTLGDSIDIVVRMRNKDTLAPAAGVSVKLWAVGLVAKFNIDNIGHGVTDASGKATIRYTHTQPVGAGIYHMWIQYDNVGVWDSPYLMPGEANNLNILHSPLKLDVQAPQSAHVGDTVTITTDISLAKDHTPVKGLVWIYKGENTGYGGKSLQEDLYPTFAPHGTWHFKITPEMGLGSQQFTALYAQPSDTPYEMPSTGFSINILPPTLSSEGATLNSNTLSPAKTPKGVK